MRVTDPLGCADGTWRVGMDETGGAVSRAPSDSRRHALGERAVVDPARRNRAATLADAGLIDAEPADPALEAAFGSAETPYLSLWY